MERLEAADGGLHESKQNNDEASITASKAMTLLQMAFGVLVMVIVLALADIAIWVIL